MTGRRELEHAHRKRCWRMMRILDRNYGTFDRIILRDLMEARHIQPIEAYLASLVREGVLRAEPDHRPDGRRFYRIAAERGDAPPLRPTSKDGEAQQPLWTALRAMRTVAIDDLAFQASTEDRPITRKQALAYMLDLVAAGYVVPVGAKGRTFRLLPTRDTGPRAPIPLPGEHAAFDLNRMSRLAGRDE